MNPTVAFARTLVDELVRHGLTDAVLAPGSRSAPLALALADDPRVRLHVRLDERSASFLALGLARTARRPVAVLCTSGTATANLHPAVVEAHAGRVPLLLLTADRPPELRGTGANQTIDQLKLYGGAVRWFCEVGAPEPGAHVYWRSLASRAWAEAAGLTGGPAGPVHLNLALREPLVGEGAAEGGRDGGAPWTVVTRDSEALARDVERAERGLVVLGDSDDDLTALADLGRAAGWPVIAEPSSNARHGEGIVSTAALLLGAERFAAAHRPDLVLCAGRVGLSRQVLALLRGAGEVLRVDPHGGWLDPVRSTARLIVADPAAVLPVTAPPHRGPWAGAWREAERAARAALDALLDAEDAPNEPRTARDLAASLPDGALLLAGSSMPIRDLDLTMRPRTGLRIVANRGASGIDGLVSTAAGAALAHDGPAWALLGDLTLLHDSNGLRDLPPNLVLVVVDNDGGGIFSLLEQAGTAQFERVFGTPHGLDLAAVAAAQGVPPTQIVVIRTDRTANAALHARMRAAVANAV